MKKNVALKSLFKIKHKLMSLAFNDSSVKKLVENTTENVREVKNDDIPVELERDVLQIKEISKRWQ